jgi:hypothetical protein
MANWIKLEPWISSGRLRRGKSWPSVGASTSMLHDPTAKRQYRRAWKDCTMDGEEIPAPSAIQNLAQVWKVLWRWRRR